MQARSYVGKRLLDLMLVGASAPFWIPVLALVAVLVRFKIGRPVFFRQERTGLNGATFTLLKFRTMTDGRGPDGALLPDAERLPSFGQALRSSSLDELPELMNILWGDMSLVGPRPLLPRYLQLYSANHQRRHQLKPGLTGLAQISGRNSLSWDERLDLDVEYVEKASLMLDARILMCTVLAVVRREGINAVGEATMSEFKGSGVQSSVAPHGSNE